MTDSSIASPTASAGLRGSPGRHRRERAVKIALLAAALASILVSVLIVLSLIGGAIQFIQQISLDTLLEDGWYPRRGEFGLSTLVVGTLLVSGVALLIAVPAGLLSAIYLAEYASPRARRTIKPILEILAGIPSVVIGFFALTFISPTVVQRLSPSSSDFSLMAAGLGVGLLSIPLIASISEDAMRAVPRSLREASYGLGARPATTAFRVVLPAAISGIIAALILGISRAIGETMVVAIAAGAVGGGLFRLDPLQPGQTMTAAMAALGFGSDQVAGDDLAFKSLYFVGALLFLMTLLLNFIGDRLVARVREEY
jgi:phosphate transport system permease protein